MELTKAEEQILHYLWKLEEATVQDILSCMDDAGKPSRTTVSTIIRILENKGAVSHKPGTGRGYIYYPLVKKEEYSRKQLFGFISRYFDNSFSSLASFFAKESNMTAEEFRYRIMKNLGMTVTAACPGRSADDWPLIPTPLFRDYA